MHWMNYLLTTLFFKLNDTLVINKKASDIGGGWSKCWPYKVQV